MNATLTRAEIARGGIKRCMEKKPDVAGNYRAAAAYSSTYGNNTVMPH